MRHTQTWPALAVLLRAVYWQCGMHARASTAGCCNTRRGPLACGPTAHCTNQVPCPSACCCCCCRAEAPCLQSYWTKCLVRVLILSKSSIDTLALKFPMQVRAIMSNMKEHVDEVRAYACVCKALHP